MLPNGNQNQGLNNLLSGIRFSRGMVFGVLILAALFAFETFNFSTTDYALSDMLGGLTFLGVKWSTILAIAFCGIDFAGVARLFTPESGRDEPGESWYLFGAWLLAAVMNAMLTWWGVSLAVLSHEGLGNSILGRETLLRVVPVFVSIQVWLIRVLIIGTFSVAGKRLFSMGERTPIQATRPAARPAAQPMAQPSAPQMAERAPRPERTGSEAAEARPALQRPAPAPIFRPAPKKVAQPEPVVRPEPSYQPVASMSASPANTSPASSPQNNGTAPNQASLPPARPSRRF